MIKLFFILRIQLFVGLFLFGLLQACATSTQFQHKDDIKASRYNAQLGINYMNNNRDLENARVKLEKALKQDNNNALAHAFSNFTRAFSRSRLLFI